MMHLRHRLGSILAGLGLLAAATTGNAQPFGTFDARSAAMGGVGVATGVRNAPFNNPALLSTSRQQHDWVLVAPIMGRQATYPDTLQDSLDVFQAAARALDNNPGDPTLQDTVASSLTDMQDGLSQTRGNAALTIAIPSSILSAAAFINVYDWANARATIDSNDIDNPGGPTYASAIDHRGGRVLENGITMAKPLRAGGWRRQMAVGFNVKLIFAEGYGYSENIRNAKTSINRGDYSTGAAFDLDLGLIKEFGVWKLGLVGKNLFSNSFRYGNTDESFKIAPQVRAGLAYQSRRTVLEFNVDVLPNAAVDYDTETQMAALGLEFKPWPWIALRGGYQQNMTGTRLGTSSAGLGLSMGFLTADIAASYNTQQRGAHAQLSFQF